MKAEPNDHTRNISNGTAIPLSAVFSGSNNRPRRQTNKRSRRAIKISMKKKGGTPNSKAPMEPLKTDPDSKTDETIKSGNRYQGLQRKPTSANGMKNSPSSVTVLKSLLSYSLGVSHAAVT